MKGAILLILFVSFATRNNGQYEEEESELKAEMDIIDLELVDYCENIAEGTRTAITKKIYDQKIEREQTFGHSMHYYSDTMEQYTDTAYEAQREWDLLRYAGDTLMPDEDYSALIKFANENQRLMATSKLPCLNETKGCTYTKPEYENDLRNARNESYLKEAWLRWQGLLQVKNAQQYPQILKLVKKAAAANDKSSEEEAVYWELLNEQTDAYQLAESLWEEIKPLYERLHEFVRKRLFEYYNITTNSTYIPVYLLGSNFGNDWSSIANIVMPHPQLHYDASSYLERRNMKDIYEIIELTLNDLKLGKPNWVSKFDQNCEPRILTYCDSERTELYNCMKGSWVGYLDAFEAALRVKINSLNYKSYMRRKLRYSILDEALVGLGSIFAIDNTVVDGIFRSYKPEDLNSETLKMSRLLLDALRILPRLPYYLAADKWRLEELKQASKNINMNWWKHRKELQKVQGVTDTETDYLGDSYILLNKPYISKFMGTLLQFQILDYVRISMTDPNGNIAQQLGNDQYFMPLLKSRDSKSWSDSMAELGIYEINSYSLQQYFAPLETYLGGAPKGQKEITTTLSTTTTTTTMRPPTTIKSDSSKKNLTESTVEEPKTRPVEQGQNTTKASGANVATFIASAVVICVCLALAFVAYRKRLFCRKPRQNNRRFET